MLQKAHRLHQEKDIKRLAQTGKTFFLPQFIFRFNNDQKATTKIAFIVSSKVEKKAIARNLLKRKMRSAIKELLPKLKPGFSILIIAKKAAQELDFAKIKDQFIFALGKMKIYEDK